MTSELLIKLRTTNVVGVVTEQELEEGIVYYTDLCEKLRLHGDLYLPVLEHAEKELSGLETWYDNLISQRLFPHLKMNN